MRPTRVWKRLLGLRRVVVEEVDFEEGEAAVVVSLRPKARERDRCPHCRRRSPGYDWGEGRRRWRALDLGTTLCFLEAEAPRVECKRHGVVVAAVPWARHDSSFTRAFEDQVCWLAVNTSKTAVSELMRIAWRTVGWVCERAMAEASAKRDLLGGLRRIGLDEISVRKGQRYLTVVVCHDSGRLVWAHPGRDKATVEKFLDLLGKDRCAQIELVSCDMADWITGPVAERCPNAAVCYDPFHLVKLATDALDEIRREVWNDARRQGQRQQARQLKGARFALWKNPDRLTERQKLKLARIQQTNQPLYRAYLLAQQLREIYRVPYEHAIVLLESWLRWARRCRLAPFVRLAKTITDQRAGIEAAIRHRLSNARVEQVNTQIRLITRRGFGFHSPHSVIALAMLTLGGLCPPLPGR
ncbi:MAG: ISL3 family transposase [Actinobacteria bacterium]|nr:ISL3 family transposase [Actinomycetota bacterium]